MADGGSSGVIPHGEGLRRALHWLDDRVRDEPAASRSRLVAEAAVKFDLTPFEEEFLLTNWVKPK